MPLPCPTPEPPPIAEVRHLTKTYRDAVAVDDVSFVLRAGAITGFLGPNGAGKTTTLRILLGLATATSGEVSIAGRHPRDLVRPWLVVGALLEADDFHPGRSGREHLLVLARAAELDDGRVDELLDAVGLSAAARRRVGGYSLGMRQRLGLAAALLGQPQLLVLDEPSNGLDPVGVRWMRDLMRAFVAGGGSVLMSSHLLAEAQHTIDHVLVIDRGRLVLDEPLDALVASGGDLESAYVAAVGTTVEIDR